MTFELQWWAYDDEHFGPSYGCECFKMPTIYPRRGRTPEEAAALMRRAVLSVLAERVSPEPPNEVVFTTKQRGT